MVESRGQPQSDFTAMAVAYLETLNPDQRRAVEHGVDARSAAPAPPLLVIAGAGSGKTNTLAHRVAHLIVNGADPRRILLMTFPAAPPPRWQGASGASRGRPWATPPAP
jgi:hypothetical protein